MGITSRGFALLERAGIVYRDEHAINVMIVVQDRAHCLLTYIRIGNRASPQAAFEWGAKIRSALGYITVLDPDDRLKLNGRSYAVAERECDRLLPASTSRIQLMKRLPVPSRELCALESVPGFRAVFCRLAGRVKALTSDSY